MALLRIPLLLALLVASGPLQSSYARARFGLTLDAAISSIPAWIGLVAIAVAFVLGTVARRDQRHATAILGLELLVAVLVAMVPPLIWLQVAPGPWNEAMGGASGTSYAQLLAVVWAMAVVRTFRGQRRSD